MIHFTINYRRSKIFYKIENFMIGWKFAYKIKLCTYREQY